MTIFFTDCLYSVMDGEIWVLHIFKKQKNKTPINEIKKAENINKIIIFNKSK